MSSATTARKKVKASMMNAIHDLPLLVARDEGFFADQGLDVEIVKTPGTGQRGARDGGGIIDPSGILAQAVASPRRTLPSATII
jgi:ABC-type nitrate/sulfonate/bicarbonate transport system substrate-binding protein